MILRHITRRLPQRGASPVLACSSRPLSTAYPSKVSAFRFAFDQEEAINRLQWWFLLHDFGAFGRFAYQNFFHMAPPAAKNRMKVGLVKKVYVPTWMVDAEVEGTVTSDDGVSDTIYPIFMNSYLPGFAFKELLPLTRLCLRTRSPVDLVPFHQSLLNHQDEEVTPIPYTISPLDIPSAVANLRNKDLEISPGWRFDPQSVKFNTLAAYPILVPAYLIEMKNDFLLDGATITAVVDARTPNPMPVWVTPSDPVWLENDISEVTFAVTRLDHEQIPPFDLVKYADKWIEDSRLPLTPASIDWDDRRIMDYSEAAENQKWLGMGEVARRIHLATKGGVKGFHLQIEGNMKGKSAEEVMDETSKALLKQREEFTPDWLRLWREEEVERVRKKQ